MKPVKILALVLLLCAFAHPRSAHSQNQNYLLINLITFTSDESRKAVDFAKSELKRGRPVIVFLNDRSVRVAARVNAAEFKEQQRLLVELMRGGAMVAACPHCLRQYGVDPSDLMAGIQVVEINVE